MNMPFRAPAQSYAGPAPETPYARATQEWDARMGAAVLSARAWRRIAVGAMAVAGVMAIGATIVALQKRTFLNVVEVSPEGQVLSVRTADGAWKPTEAQIAYHLGRFVRLVRSLPTDGVVLKQNWLEAYKLLTPGAAAHLTDLARSDDPFMALGRVGRTIHIRSVIQRSDHAWEVSWIERATNETGVDDVAVYSGVFSTALRTPHTADEIATNPLGLLITDFSWSRER